MSKKRIITLLAIAVLLIVAIVVGTGIRNEKVHTMDAEKTPAEEQQGTVEQGTIAEQEPEEDTVENAPVRVTGEKYENDFKVIAYYPNWYGDFTAQVQWDKLTHINYAFVLPNRNGTVDSVSGSAQVIKSLIETAHENNVKVNMAIGGWSYSDGSLCATVFEAATDTDEKCQSLANGVLELVDEYGFDGVDVDWEYPTADSVDQYTSFLQYLKEGLDERGKLLTAAVQAVGGTYQTDEALQLFDWINVMAYDGNSGSGHSPYEYLVQSFEYWNGTRGVPAEKIMLGVPFYERPNWASFADIVKADPANAYEDSAVINGTTVYYNGIPTMEQKAAYAAQNAGGIMIWEIHQDAKGEQSLLNAIYDTVTAKQSEKASGDPEEWDMDVTEETLEIPGVEKEYNFLFVTDTHMIVPDEADSDEVEEYADTRFEEFKNEEAIPSAEQFDEWVGYANEQQADALLLGGDIIDYPSEANIGHLEENLDDLAVPYMYTPGNHDWTLPWEYMTQYAQETYLPMLEPYMKANTAIQEMELDEIIVVAVDNSTNQIAPEAMEQYKQILQKGKPVIVMLHVPLLTQSVLTVAKEVWPSPVVLGGGNYGGIYPDETSTEFINLTTAEDSPVVAVLAGHVHFFDKDMINEKIVQIVGDAGFKGEAVWITVIGEE